MDRYMSVSVTNNVITARHAMRPFVKIFLPPAISISECTERTSVLPNTSSCRTHSSTRVLIGPTCRELAIV